MLTMLELHELTAKPDYVDWARQLAEMETSFLAEPPPEETPEWWRWPFRNQFLKAMVELHARERGERPHGASIPGA